MSTQEKQDLEILKAQVLKRKETTYDYMKSFLKMPASQIPHTGYKSVEDALKLILTDSEIQIGKLHAAFLKKYPD